MILNFARSELHFDYTDSFLNIFDRISEKSVWINHYNLNDSQLILDIQEKIMFDYNVWSIDYTSFQNIKDYVREIKTKYPKAN
jgi:uncharacterized protein YpbB